MQKIEGLYVLPIANGGAVNLVVGSKTFRLAEFDDFEKAVSFADRKSTRLNSSHW